MAALRAPGRVFGGGLLRLLTSSRPTLRLEVNSFCSPARNEASADPVDLLTRTVHILFATLHDQGRSGLPDW